MTLECTEARAENGTPSRYTTQKAKPGIPSTHRFIQAICLARRPEVALIGSVIQTVIPLKASVPACRIERTRRNGWS